MQTVRSRSCRRCLRHQHLRITRRCGSGPGAGAAGGGVMQNTAHSGGALRLRRRLHPRWQPRRRRRLLRLRRLRNERRGRGGQAAVPGLTWIDGDLARDVAARPSAASTPAGRRPAARVRVQSADRARGPRSCPGARRRSAEPGPVIGGRSTGTTPVAYAAAQPSTLRA